jgi:hypothetical protein
MIGQPVETFLNLRPRLHDVREQEVGWILALFDYNSTDESALKLLTELCNEGVVSEIRREGMLVLPPALGDTGSLELRIDRGHLPGYFETYDSLIRSYPDIAPDNYVVWEANHLLEAGYIATCTLLQFLKGKAEVWDSTGQRFYLVDQEAVEVPLASYSAKHTTDLPLVLTRFTRFLDNAHLDADTRWALLRKSSVRLLRDSAKDRRLGLLIQNLSNTLDRAERDYSLYLERFSFEDLIRNFDDKRLKFVGDLNQILASIQTSLIAVPIGFFLIAEKFRPTNGWLGQNIILMTAGVLFFVLLFVLSLNQGKTLQGIRLALIDFVAEQRKKVTEKTERLERLISNTWSQYNRVRLFLWTVQALLLLFGVLVVVTGLWCSLPAWQRSLPYVMNATNSPITKAP